METTENLSTEHQEAIAEAAGRLLQEQELAAAADYVNAHVSASTSAGPDGATLDGWITYTKPGPKIRFRLTGEPNTWGAGAAAGFLPVLGALPASQLEGKVGTYRVNGSLVGADLQMWVDGRPVLRIWLPMPGSGTP